MTKKYVYRTRGEVLMPKNTEAVKLGGASIMFVYVLVIEQYNNEDKLPSDSSTSHEIIS